MSAEDDLRAAFERLKLGNTKILAPRSPVTQNNVAREAGKDPSAFKKSRYPTLILEIQAYVASRSSSAGKAKQQKIIRSRKEARSLRQQLEDTRKERDLAYSLLVGADQTILELHGRISDLESRVPKSNVVSITRSK